MDKNKYLIDLSESERTDLGRLEFEKQTEPQRVFSAIWELEAEVNNGGFSQFFFNKDSDLIIYAPAALRAIGAVSCAGTVDRAIDVVAPLLPEWNARREKIAALGEEQEDRLDALDSEFYAYPDNLTDLLFDYVALHPEAFGPVGCL
jgi:hypothetical protein